MTELTFEQFLQTASPDAHTARQQARDYQPMPYLWRIQGEVRKTQVETAMIIHDTEARLKNLLQSDPDEASEYVATRILRALSRLYEVEFYINLADPEVAHLFSQAQTLGVLNADEVSRITAAALYEPGKPWPNATLYDVLLKRGQCETSKKVQPVGRQAVIELQGEFEPHKPRLLALNEITEQWQRINNFATPDNKPCTIPGKYTCIIPPQFAGWPLEVDNPYGAVV